MLTGEVRELHQRGDEPLEVADEGVVLLTANVKNTAQHVLLRTHRSTQHRTSRDRGREGEREGTHTHTTPHHSQRAQSQRKKKR